MQDFGDGPVGAVYQHKLNAFLRYSIKEYPDHFLDAFTEEGHDISVILQQIESESALMVTDTAGSEEQDKGQHACLETADEKIQEILVAAADQQESTALNVVQLEIENNPTVTRKIFKAPWKTRNRETISRKAGIRGAEGGASSVGRVKFGLGRLARLFKW